MEEVASAIENKNQDYFSNNGDSTSTASLLPRPSTRKRPTLVVVGGISYTFILDSVDAFSFARGRRLPCPPMPVNSLTWFSASVAGNTLILFGGICVSIGFIFIISITHLARAKVRSLLKYW